MIGPPVPSTYSRVIVILPILSSFGISYIISSINSSMMARSALAPVSFSIAFSAIASSAPVSNSSFTSSSASSFWYCFKMAFRGSLRILTIISLLRPSSVKMIGRRPINSGIIPNFLISSTVTRLKIFFSLSYLSRSSAL